MGGREEGGNWGEQMREQARLWLANKAEEIYKLKDLSTDEGAGKIVVSNKQRKYMSLKIYQ